MSPRRASAALLAFASAAGACGLGATGSLGSAASNPDASAVGEAGIGPGGDASASTDAAGDGPLAARCDAGHITDPLSTIDTTRWLVFHDVSNGDHPKIDPSAEGPAVSLVLPGAATSLGSIWLQPPIALKAFDVSFRYLMTCPAAGGCADGLAVAWLEDTAAGSAALQTTVSTATFGLPAVLHGAAIAFDVHQDIATGDPATPAISLLALDGRTPGTYDWHTKSAPEAVLAGAHDVAIRVRQGTAEVKLDGTVALTGAVSTDFTGWFGFAASSGAELGTFVVRNFDATFYECDNP